MCKVEKDGYYLLKSSGRKIPFTASLDELNLTKEELLELYETPANIMEIWRVRQNLHDIRNKMQSLTNKLNQLADEVAKIADLFGKSAERCPVNQNAVKEIALDVLRNASRDKTDENILFREAITTATDKAVSRHNLYLKFLLGLVSLLSVFGLLKALGL